MKMFNRLIILIIALALLVPLGLWLPEYFKAQAAWGEWGLDEIQKLVGYIPKGLAKFSSFWSAPMPDYTLRGWEDKGLPFLSFSYIISAFIGILICVSVILLLGKFLSKK